MKRWALLLLVWLGPPGVVSQQLSATGSGGMVVCVDRLAARIGADILRKGGNAVDAAVATAFALAVTYPQAGNIGGGGFMLVRRADGRAAVIDYREKAPAAAHARMFLLEDGTLDTVRSEYGYLVAGIPGTVRGLETAWKQFGRLTWPELIEPAIRLAEEGFELAAFQALQIQRYAFELQRFDETRKIFFKKDGSPYASGELLVQRDLAQTLRRIAGQGGDVFYRGDLADRMVDDVRRHGGNWTREDLAAYNAVVREPVRGTYRGYEVLGAPPPSAGGVILIEMLNVLESADLSEPFDDAKVHLMVEAMRRAYYDRSRYLGDPDFENMPVEELISKEYARSLFGGIDQQKATASMGLHREAGGVKENMETTHFSIIDREGNAVANTFTLEDNFGSKAVVSGLGFLLNNEMHDFNINPDVPSHQGGFGDNPNLIGPGKRMLSSMSPTIVLREGRPFLITGSPGGRTITNTVLQVLIGMIDRGMTLRQAVDAARVNHNWLPDVIRYEAGRWDRSILAKLQKRRHSLREIEFLGDAHSIWIDPVSGLYHGEADFRRMGWAEGF